MLFMRTSKINLRTLIATSLTLALLMLTAHAPDAHAQRRRSTIKNFQGAWLWGTYAKSRRELPPAYRNMSVREVPREYIAFGLSQTGDELSGDIDAGQRFLAKVEHNEFTTKIKNNIARVTLESGHGGKVTATIALRNNRLYWKIVEQEGEHYFPLEAVLHRTSKTVEF